MNTVVGVNHSARRWSAVLDGHVQGVNYQVGILIIIYRPANDLATKGIKDGAAIEFSLSGQMFGNVSNPELFGLRACELPVD